MRKYKRKLLFVAVCALIALFALPILSSNLPPGINHGSRRTASTGQDSESSTVDGSQAGGVTPFFQPNTYEILKERQAFGPIPLPAPGAERSVKIKEFALNTPLPQFPPEARVLQVGNAPASLARAQDLAKRLGLSGEPQAADAEFHLSSPAGNLTYYPRAEGFFFSSGDGGKRPQSFPKSGSEAQGWAVDFLKGARLLPEDSQSITVFSSPSAGSGSETPRRWTIEFRRQLEGLPVEGFWTPGIKVMLEADGQIYLSGVHHPIAAASTYPLRPVQEAWEEIKAGHWLWSDGILTGGGEVVIPRFTVTQVALVYREAEVPFLQDYLSPLYGFSDGQVTLYASALPVSQVAWLKDARATLEGFRDHLLLVRQGDLFTLRADGSGLRRLTDDGRNAYGDVSPDGKKILFIKTAEGGTADWGEVWSMGVDGQAPGRLLSLADLPEQARPVGTPSPSAGFFAPAWSPDGRHFLALVFNNIVPMGPVAVSQADGTDLHLLESPWPYDLAAWSPEGDAIALVNGSSDVRPHDLYLVNPRGGEAAQLTEGFFISSFSWSPDGRQLAFASSVKFTFGQDGARGRNRESTLGTAERGGAVRILMSSREKGAVSGEPGTSLPTGLGDLAWLPLPKAAISTDQTEVAATGDDALGGTVGSIPATDASQRAISVAARNMSLAGISRAQTARSATAGGELSLSGRACLAYTAWYGKDENRAAAKGILYTMALDTLSSEAIASGLTPASRQNGSYRPNTGVSWTADGRHYLFLRAGDIWVGSVQGGEPRQLTFTGDVQYAQWFSRYRGQPVPLMQQVGR
ncbi:MAG: hypothetical protein M1299_02285 [Firmicutes bacterium]|nr:hypothetical protein [Bacillota bacterium]